MLPAGNVEKLARERQTDREREINRERDRPVVHI